MPNPDLGHADEEWRIKDQEFQIYFMKMLLSALIIVVTAAIAIQTRNVLFAVAFVVEILIVILAARRNRR